MPCDNKQPIRYLLTLNRHDAVKQLRAQLLVFLDEDESWDLIIAEVFDNHIARVLVSLTLCLLMPLISFTGHSASCHSRYSDFSYYTAMESRAFNCSDFH